MDGPYCFVIGTCCGCRAVITFDPEHVPSLRVQGERQPLCRGCHARWNEIHRTSKGLAPIAAHPGAWPSDERSEIHERE